MLSLPYTPVMYKGVRYADISQSFATKGDAINSAAMGTKVWSIGDMYFFTGDRATAKLLAAEMGLEFRQLKA